MHGTLFEGDYVVINKLAYGARLPLTPLSLDLAGKKKFVDWIKLPYFRFFGYSEIKRNDIIAFNFDLSDQLPIDEREEYIKRCVAIPGDTIEIINSKVYVNRRLDEPFSVYKSYTVVSDHELDTLLLKKLNIYQNSFSTDKRIYTLHMSATQADSLYKLSHIKSISQQPLEKKVYHPSVYPNHPSFLWNNDFFGPLYIPRKGDSILINKENLILYQRTLERFENVKFSFKNDSIFINNKFLHYFLFNNSYFFMMGDNRYNSIDSRTFGFIPESHIIGRTGMKFSTSHKWELSLH